MFAVVPAGVVVIDPALGKFKAVDNVVVLGLVLTVVLGVGVAPAVAPGVVPDVVVVLGVFVVSGVVMSAEV